MSYRWITGVAALLMLGLAAAPASAINCSADVPMRFWGTSPAVEVTVNGRSGFLFLVDTAAAGMARADLTLVKTLALSPTGQTEVTDGTSAPPLIVDRYELAQVRLGNMSLSAVRAQARDYNTTPHLPAIAGILGFNFFKDCLLTLDYRARRVRVTGGELPPANGRDIVAFKDDGGPFVTMTLGAAETSALIDSGSQLGILVPVAMVKNLPLASYRRTIGTGRTVTNQFEISEVTIQDSLAIGSYRLDRPVINFANVFDEVVIGSVALHQLTLTFDQKNGRVRIKQ
jgi:hypothetical protein